MLFNSIQFLFFFPLVTLIYFLLPHKYRWLLLLIASCIFYMAFIPVYILILFFTIVVDYFAGIIIENAAGKNRKLYLSFSIIANVGVLAFFKYYNFFIENVNALLHSLHFTVYPIPYLNIILPIGLSFHTFQAMSYTIEIYRGNQKAERHFGIYALYVMFYPQLVAGPIERPQNLLHQFREHHKFSSQNLLDGLRLMLWGFFKKLVIADRVALYVNTVYNFPANYHYLNLIIASLFFTIQIYCDFSGYSDIAIGAAKTMGFDLMTNFNKPYFSKNIQEFWKRWHISLSTWLRDYLFTPIAMDKRDWGIYALVFAQMITFFISGLWHGANWTYIIWGMLHGFYILIYIYYKSLVKTKFKKNRLLDLLSIGFTFLLVAFSLIFFRATSISNAFLIINHIFTLHNTQAFQPVVENLSTFSAFGIFSTIISLSMIALLFLLEIKLVAKLTNLNKNPFIDVAFCTTILFLIINLGIFNNNSFIYFQF